MDRDAALALLRSQHAFPGPFEFRVVVLPGAVAPVVSAISAAGGAPAQISERKSRAGKYVAIHARVEVDSAERVLDVYEVLRGIDGVITSL